MKKLIFIVLVGTLLLSISCNQKSRFITTVDSFFITIDLDNATKIERIPLSSYFKSACIVILESSDSTLIGDIDGVQVSSEYIFILDKYITKSLFVFNKEGKFIRKIGTRGQGPGEYEQIYDFTLDLDKNEVYTMDVDKQAIHQYNFESGEYLGSIELTDPFNYMKHIQFIDGRLFGDTEFEDNRLQSNNHMLVEIDLSTGNTIGKWLDINMYSCGINDRVLKDESYFYCKTLSEPLFYKNYMDTIVVLKEDGVYPHVAIKCKNWVNKKHIDNIIKEYSWDLLDDKLSESSHISFDIRHYIESEKIIYFTYKNNFNYSRRVLHDKEIGVTFIIDSFYDEDLDYYLPKIGCCDENGIYTYIDPGLMDYFLTEFLPRNETFRKNSSKYKELIELSVESNPILFYYEYH